MNSSLTQFLVEYMPHGQCYAWNPYILWTSVLSDIVIAAAYFSIPIALVIITKKRKDLQFKGVFILFALFIMACGITHLVSVYTIWHGAYGIHSITKLATAVVSFTTAIYMYLKIDSFLAIPSIEEHKRFVEDATKQQFYQKELEIERKATAIFRATTKMVPTGLLVIDENQKVLLANNAAETMFGYEEDELTGSDLSRLIAIDDLDRHKILVKNFMRNESDTHSMASGRVVPGKRKDGSEVSVEIKIAVQRHEGVVHAFANIIDVEKEKRDKSQSYENSSRVKRALEATNDGVWEWNVQTNDVWYSPKFLQLIGRDPNEQGQYTYWEQHIHTDDREHVLETLKKHFARNGRYDVVYRGDTGGGIYEWMHARGDTIFDENGLPTLMSGTLTNVQEVRELKAELEEKSQFITEILNRSLTGLYIFSLKTFRNTFINPEYTRLCGYTLDDLNKIQDEEGSLFGLFHPDERKIIENHFADVVAEKHPDGVGIEYRFKHKDGHWIWCYSRDSIYSYDKNGDPDSMLGAFFDITNIKNREKEVREYAMNFTSTFDQAAVGMALVSLDGHFQKVNEKLCQIMGYTSNELSEMKFADITHPDDLAESRAYLQKMLEGKAKHFELEKRYITKSGRVIWAKVTVATVIDYTGEKSHFSMVVEDITESKALETELAASNASLERFAYSASHDLQEPLRKISAFAGLLETRLDGKLDDPEAVFQLNRISDAAKRMGEMIRSLLELSRFSRLQVEKENVALSDMLSVVLEDLSVKISKREAVIDIKNDLDIYVEKNSFQQVLRNLISNSIRYTPLSEKPEIEIDVIEGDKSVAVKVTDNGIGIDPSKVELIFEPFRRLQNMNSKGTGMGLSICRQIVRSHNGTIVAEPREKGACFTITLPKV